MSRHRPADFALRGGAVPLARPQDGTACQRPAHDRGTPVMPEIVVYMFEGRTLEQKRTLVRNLTDAVTGSLSVPQEAVTVQLIEGPRHHRARGGRLISDMDAEKAK